MTFAALEERISGLEADLAAEQSAIEAAVAARQIGAGYWQRRHELARRLRIARAFQEAIAEAGL